MVAVSIPSPHASESVDQGLIALHDAARQEAARIRRRAERVSMSAPDMSIKTLWALIISAFKGNPPSFVKL